MVLLNDNVDPQDHIKDVNRAINSTASCGGSAKSRIGNTMLLKTAGLYTATLSPAMEAFLQNNPDVNILQQDAKSSFDRSVSVRRPATRRALTAFKTSWCVWESAFCS
jgi:hypothetical protein